MADKEKYMIKVEGKLVEVTPDVYYAYFRMERQERWQEEKQQGHAVVSYDALDDGETVGMEVVPDLTTPSMEEAVMTREIYEKLHRALDALPKAERELIQAIYFDGFTEKEYAVSSGLSQQGVSYRLRKILSKLRIFMDYIGSF
jgi:RNA polymerase sigma factor (sigma-70 family)